MKARVLPKEEWGRANLPPGLEAIMPQEVTMVAVEEDGQVVARVAVMRMTYLEAIWIDPEHRNAGVASALLRELSKASRKYGDRWVLGGVAEGDHVMQSIMDRIGAREIPAQFYAVGVGG